MTERKTRPSGRSSRAKALRAAYRRAPLASLRVFVAVADHQSFTRGADALGLTTSAVSMQVQGLALARWSVVGDEVASGRLAVAGRAVKSERAYYFVCRRRIWSTTK